GGLARLGARFDLPLARGHHALHLDAHGEHLPLAPLRPLLHLADLDGEATLDAKLSGTTKKPELSLTFAADGVATGAITGSRVSLEGQVGAAGLSGKARVELHAGGVPAGTVEIDAR